eukprot:TRINITY_DN8968_c0_g1_i1.p1 TRINITY_DN8968_c0_g1~~TRINITY_DN8968_c0_g1_i1.p1  ORF type:complete len:138 (-),score=25.94 TRINITY_DN8968_c0_g1_i1:38-451(-)
MLRLVFSKRLTAVVRSNNAFAGHPFRLLTRSLRTASSRPSFLSASPSSSVSSVVISHRMKSTSSDTKAKALYQENTLFQPESAQDLINEVPPIEIAANSVQCDGGGGALGHPRVFINLDKGGAHSCGYCGLRFTRKK